LHRDIVVIGASAGGVEALSETVAGLPADLDAAVFVVLHLPAQSPSLLPMVLQRRTSLPTLSPSDGEPIRPRHIYVCPPDRHLLLRSGAVQLTRGAKENGHRPAVDTLFRSAAHTFGARVVGVVLSGAMDDGALGLRAIASHGGMPIVQDPEDAAFPGMPVSALQAVPEATVAPDREIGGMIAAACNPSALVEAMPAMEEDREMREDQSMEVGRNGDPTVFTCPECHGTLFVNGEDDLVRFRCRVGHGFSSESLLAGESEALEAALWTALRALEERNDLLRRMCERARRQGQLHVAERFEERARDGARNMGILRNVLFSGETEHDEPA
jgi:two-component system chemotaxis response regulator CheB